MKRSSNRILTTHVGSLIRPPQLLELVRAREKGDAADGRAYEQCLKDSVAEVVRRQAQAGIDIVNDGEFGKSTSWALYALKRVSGFEMRPVKPGANPFARGADRERFKEFYAELEGGNDRTWSNVTQQEAVCVAPVKYTGLGELQHDIDNLKAALQAVKVEEAFLPVAAPSSAIPDRKNEYYKNDEELVIALAEALRTEYRAIVDAGFLLQVDDASRRHLRSYGASRKLRGLLPLGRPPRRCSESCVGRNPRRPRALPRLLGKLAGAAHHRRASEKNRRSHSQSPRRRVPHRSRESPART